MYIVPAWTFVCVIDNISANMYESLNWHCTIILQFIFLSGYCFHCTDWQEGNADCGWSTDGSVERNIGHLDTFIQLRAGGQCCCQLHSGVSGLSLCTDLHGQLVVSWSLCVVVKFILVFYSVVPYIVNAEIFPLEMRGLLLEIGTCFLDFE